jgi:hypothetical protein
MEDQPREVSRYVKLGKAKKGVRTGAKNPGNGSPLLRAKAQNCRDAAARAAITDAARLIIITAPMKFVPGRLFVAVKNRVRIG